MTGTNNNQNSIADIAEMGQQIRRDIIKMLLISGSGHSGGPLGLADIFASLYFRILKRDSSNPNWPERDYFFLSAGHLAPVWYATLARAGYFPIEELSTLRKINTRLQGHPAPAYTHGAPGVEVASGSLGQGMSIAVGTCLGLRLDKKPNRVVVLHGDGELDEGQVWESMMTAGHYGLDNLTAIVDRNFCQIDNRTDKVMEIEPLADKWRAFRWNVIECDGHNVEEFIGAMEEAQATRGKPSVVIAKTFMGRGVSFMEDNYKWHGVPPNQEQAKQALLEIPPTKFGDFITFEWEEEVPETAKQS
ncbi:MAG: transketolase [Ignavibacteria bacterium]|nr:transketolase [Ignavibacteria bacterium]